MTRPYSSTEYAPIPTPSNAQKLTPRGEAILRELIQETDTRLADLRVDRDDLLGDAASIEAVMADLSTENDRRRARLIGDFISLLPTDQPAASLFTPQGDAQAHATQWGEQGPAPTRCGACQELVVLTDRGWVHTGRELKDDGHLCNPGRSDSPAAKPAAPGEMSADPETLVANFKAAHDEYDASEGGRR